jgi:hypothetical protein
MAKKSSGALPDIMGPLNVPPQPGDKLVPPNDMAEVGGSMCKGKEVPDPNNYVGPVK